MRARHPICWLMTDERLGDGLWDALERLPRGAGVVFRHHATPSGERRRLFAKVARVARARGLVLVRAGAVRMRGEQGVHKRRGAGLVTWPAHDRREAVAAVRAGARVVFVSPLFATRSHPGAPALGKARAATIARGLPVTAIALGGMDARRWRDVRALGFDGYAAIDAWLLTRRDGGDCHDARRQKRKAVPT
ncbi:thiamine phosphate synthase [Sphingomonas endophytica]|uniref:Thiamine monophosphate synthase n=1 Tax=Sphingomonas endophytica TaxID=869719 RepID=A0A147I894_9SPHN|nr:thiamine phosphate synthase [Sphingomonas endophytica]KTT75271.1 thiamine monophosphate synthase [Sphingomonas endophytica]